MLLCLLLAAALGGVAAANPGSGLRSAAAGDATGEQVPVVASSSLDEDTAPETPEVDGGSVDHAGQGDHEGRGEHAADAHTSAECAQTIDQILGELSQTGDAHGLANAIAHVDDNCSRIEHAPGLIRAMHQLTVIFERKLAHERGRPDDPGNAGQGPSKPADAAKPADPGPPAGAGKPQGAGNS